MTRSRSSTPGRSERGRVAKPSSRSGRPQPPSTGGPSGWETPLPGDLDLEVDPAELSEFLAGDLLDVQADPVFKERLRQKLWRLVRVRFGDGADED